MVDHTRHDLKFGQHLVIGDIEGTTQLVTSNNVEIIEDLKCDHEEADSRMIMYAAYFCRVYALTNVIIKSDDTDVIIILLYHSFSSLQNCCIWFLTGKKDKKRYYPLHTSAKSLGEDICQLLPAAHALTGCDSTASFHFIGKGKAFNVSKVKCQALSAMKCLGNDPILIKDSPEFNSALHFVCWLYDKNFNSLDVTELRKQLFCRKNKSGTSLPPILENLTCHFARVVYQVYIWRHADKPILNLPKPYLTDGWLLGENGKLQFAFSKKDPIPSEILSFIACKCKTGCKEGSRCSCRQAKLVCTDACFCGVSCKNIELTSSSESYDEAQEDESDDEETA